MIRILFICLGNICRSPMAECIMKELVRQKGYEDQFEIASAATSSYNVRNGRGAPIYYAARNQLDKHQIPCHNQYAQVLKRSDYAYYTYLIGMDADNVSDIKYIVGGDPNDKIRKLLDFSDQPRDIADPYYTNDFDQAYRDIEKGCRALLVYLTSSQ